jgi:hypothetical protein
MNTECIVNRGLYETNSKKYIDIELSPEDTQTVTETHRNSYDKLTKRNIRIPLDDNVLKVKIPFRNKRVSCITLGDKTVYELVPGDKIDVVLTYNGAWSYGDFCGLAWTVNLITTPRVRVLPSS